MISFLSQICFIANVSIPRLAFLARGLPMLIYFISYAFGANKAKKTCINIYSTVDSLQCVTPASFLALLFHILCIVKNKITAVRKFALHQARIPSIWNLPSAQILARRIISNKISGSNFPRKNTAGPKFIIYMNSVLFLTTKQLKILLRERWIRFCCQPYRQKF